MKPKLLLPVIAVALVTLSGCATTKINRLLADPHHYRNREVHVEGTVTNVIGALNTGVYQVQDDTGKIYVISGRGIPPKGARVKVHGSLTEGFNIMGRSFGTVIREDGHKINY
jgi:hypothetical protein